MTQYSQQIPSAQNILPKISRQSYHKVRPRVGVFLFKNCKDHGSACVGLIFQSLKR